MYGGRTVTVVLPAFNEEPHIRQAVEDFLASGVVDEVLVVDNNSRDRTAEVARSTAARLVQEPAQGYGHALRRGLREASGDLVILAEPDGTFVGRDVLKLLAYADDFDMVCGTRTTRELIWTQANMGWFLRVGNLVVAKFLQVLFGGPSLTDCGCTLRLTHKAAVAAAARRPDRRRFALPARDGDPGAQARAAGHRGAGELPRPRRRVEDHRHAEGHAAHRLRDDRPDPQVPGRAVTWRRAAVVVALAATLPYLPTLDNYFVQDDFGVVALLASKPATYFPRWFVTTWMEDIWGYTPDEIRPFPAVSYQIAARFGAASPVANHVINIAFHAVNAVLVLAVAQRAAGLGLAAATVAALVFALLPMQTESVAWITGRVDSMPACFFLASFLLYVRWRSEQRRRDYAWSVAWCAVALLSKQNTVVLAPVLMAFDLVVRRAPVRIAWTWLRTVRAVHRADRRLPGAALRAVR